MKLSYITIPDEYKVMQMQFLYQDTRLFSLKTKVDMSDDDFDYDAHIDDLWFYKGILSYHADTETAVAYYFEQKKVFELGTNCGSAPVLFYAACSEDYSKVFFYKRDLVKGSSTLVHTLDTCLLDIEPLTAPLHLSHMYTLNERYALISYMVTGRKVRYERYDALLDSLTGECIYFTADKIWSYMECMLPYHYSGKDYVWIKTGEHMIHERRMDWLKNEREPEDIILIEVEKLITMALQNQLDFAPFILHSSQPNEAFTDYIAVDGQIILLIEQFDTEYSVLITYDIDQQAIDRIAQHRVYDRIYPKQGKLYAREQTDHSSILYDLQTGNPICEVPDPKQIIALCEQGVLTTNTRLGNEDNTVYLHTDQEMTIFAEGHYFMDYEQELMLLIQDEVQ